MATTTSSQQRLGISSTVSAGTSVADSTRSYVLTTGTLNQLSGYADSAVTLIATTDITASATSPDTNLI